MARTVFISGCNRGIGREAVKLFAAQGDNLICCIRRENEEFAEFTAGLRARYGVEIECICCDMADEESIKAAVSPLVKAKRRVDVLINNAGIATGGLLQMTAMKQIRDVFQVNFFSHVCITQMLVRLMIRQKSGVIINMGSVAGLENFAGYTAYGSGKAALMFFTRTIARELAPHGIRVNAIAPGLTDTGMAGQMEEKAWHEMVERTDMNRLGRPEEIAKTMLWLASEDASFITGQIIRVDGGM